MCVISLHYIGAYPMKEPKCKKRNLGVMSKIVSYITDFPRCISHLLKKKNSFPQYVSPNASVKTRNATIKNKKQLLRDTICSSKKYRYLGVTKI